MTDTTDETDHDSIVDATLAAASEYPVLANADHDVSHPDETTTEVRWDDPPGAVVVKVTQTGIEEFGDGYLDALCKRAAEQLMANKQEDRR